MSWNEVDLGRVLKELRTRRGDSTSVEVKRASAGLPNIAETVSAFANMPAGGSIVLGIDEASGSFDVVGVRDVAELSAGLVSTARNAVSPSPFIDVQEFRLDGKAVLVAHVSPLRILDRPATTRGKAYLRQVDGDYVMQEHELRMLEVAKLHADEQGHYDLQPALGKSAGDLVPEMVGHYVATVRSRDRRLSERTDEEILRATNVVTSDSEPTLAGLYALGDYPQGQYPGLTVTAAEQMPRGEGRGRTRDLQDFTGPVPVLLDSLMQWVERHLTYEQHYRPDGHMVDVPELPLNAVRELLANALVHRDLGPNTLGLGKSVQVRLTPDKLLIQSPGGLRGVSLQQIESDEHAQAAVNQRLYQIAKKLRTADGATVIEGEGGGIREVFRSILERGLPRPHLIDTGVQFTAILWRDPAQLRSDTPPVAPVIEEVPSALVDPGVGSSRPTRHEARVLRALGDHTAMSLRDIMAATGLTAGQVRYALALPVEEGLVVMEGGQGSRRTAYRRSPSPSG